MTVTGQTRNSQLVNVKCMPILCLHQCSPCARCIQSSVAGKPQNHKLKAKIPESAVQRLDALKLQLRSGGSNGSSGSSSRFGEAGEEDVLKCDLSEAAAALQTQRAADILTAKQQQQQLQRCLPHLQLQLQLHAADAAAPAIDLNIEADVMAAAQQGRYILPPIFHPLPPPPCHSYGH